jgi:hypothetical protein
MLGVKRFRWHRSKSQVVVVGTNTGEPKAKHTHGNAHSRERWEA